MFDAIQLFRAFGHSSGHSSVTIVFRPALQPSFYTILCGDAREYTVGEHECYNPSLGVRTRLLDRKRFPNGAMDISKITARSR
jgi:hypothetical protein